MANASRELAFCAAVFSGRVAQKGSNSNVRVIIGSDRVPVTLEGCAANAILPVLDSCGSRNPPGGWREIDRLVGVRGHLHSSWGSGIVGALTCHLSGRSL